MRSLVSRHCSTQRNRFQPVVQSTPVPVLGLVSPWLLPRLSASPIQATRSSDAASASEVREADDADDGQAVSKGADRQAEGRAVRKTRQDQERIGKDADEQRARTHGEASTSAPSPQQRKGSSRSTATSRSARPVGDSSAGQSDKASAQTRAPSKRSTATQGPSARDRQAQMYQRWQEEWEEEQWQRQQELQQQQRQQSQQQRAGRQRQGQQQARSSAERGRQSGGARRASITAGMAVAATALASGAVALSQGSRTEGSRPASEAVSQAVEDRGQGQGPSRQTQAGMSRPLSPHSGASSNQYSPSLQIQLSDAGAIAANEAFVSRIREVAQDRQLPTLLEVVDTLQSLHAKALESHKQFQEESGSRAGSHSSQASAGWATALWDNAKPTTAALASSSSEAVTAHSQGSTQPSRSYLGALHHLLVKGEGVAPAPGGSQSGGEGLGEGQAGDASEVDAGKEEEEAGGGGEHGKGLTYRDEVEVVSDALDTLLGVRLPTKAFYGARAEALAALSIDQVKAVCKRWVGVCGADYSRIFLTKEPRLLVEDPSSLLVALEALSTVLGLQPSEAVDWAARNTCLVVTITKERLQGTVSELSFLLAVGPEDAAKMLTRWTQALNFKPGDLSERFRVLEGLLPIGAARLRAVCAKRPQLLGRAPTTIAASLFGLSALIGTSLEQAAVMLAAEPGIAGVSAQRLSSRWQRLTSLASRHPPWASQLAAQGPASLARCLTAPDESLNRLAFVLRNGIQDHSEGRDLKRLLLMTKKYFRTQVVTLATPPPLRRRGDQQGADAASGQQEQGGDGPTSSRASAPDRPSESGRRQAPAAAGEEQSDGVPTSAAGVQGGLVGSYAGVPVPQGATATTAAASPAVQAARASTAV